eukprot:3741416-Prymnesium_polylepis.1
MQPPMCAQLLLAVREPSLREEAMPPRGQELVIATPPLSARAGKHEQTALPGACWCACGYDKAARVGTLVSPAQDPPYASKAANQFVVSNLTTAAKDALHTALKDARCFEPWLPAG